MRALKLAMRPSLGWSSDSLTFQHLASTEAKMDSGAESNDCSPRKMLEPVEKMAMEGIA